MYSNCNSTQTGSYLETLVGVCRGFDFVHVGDLGFSSDPFCGSQDVGHETVQQHGQNATCPSRHDVCSVISYKTPAMH